MYDSQSLSQSYYMIREHKISGKIMPSYHYRVKYTMHNKVDHEEAKLEGNYKKKIKVWKIITHARQASQHSYK